jgi:hypothetical protein
MPLTILLILRRRLEGPYRQGMGSPNAQLARPTPNFVSPNDSVKFAGRKCKTIFHKWNQSGKDWEGTAALQAWLPRASVGPKSEHTARLAANEKRPKAALYFGQGPKFPVGTESWRSVTQFGLEALRGCHENFLATTEWVQFTGWGQNISANQMNSGSNLSTRSRRNPEPVRLQAQAATRTRIITAVARAIKM